MKIGLALPHYDFSFPDGRAASVADMLAFAQRAEQLGFDSVWVSDHLFFDIAKYGGPPERFSTPECMTMLAAIAAATDRVRIGSLVLNTSFRHPRMLVHQAMSIDQLSGGRLDLGIGSGWYEPEFLAAGIPFGTAGQRMERLSRVASILDAYLMPRAPLWVGGKGGPKLMRVIAEYADGWNVAWRLEPSILKERLGTLRAACEEFKRDPATVEISAGMYTMLARDERDLERRFDAARAWSRGVLDGVTIESFAKGALVGTAQLCAERARALEEMGVSTLILNLAPLPFSVFADDQLELAAAELLPLLR